MGRTRKSRALWVWMNAERVGEWRRSATGAHEFAYAQEWMTASAARPISLSLPFNPQPYRKGVQEFFDNLLPDNRARRSDSIVNGTVAAARLLGEQLAKGR